MQVPPDPCASGVGKEASTRPEVTDVEEHKLGAQPYFTGVVKNDGAKSLSSLQIEVNL